MSEFDPYRRGTLVPQATGICRAHAGGIEWFRFADEDQDAFIARVKIAARASGFRFVDVAGAISSGLEEIDLATANEVPA